MLKEILKPYTLLLASASPRRQMLLAELDLFFTVPPLIEVEEDYPIDSPIKEVAGYLAQKKAQAYLTLLTPRDILITSDTVVICDNKLLGKPSSLQNAKEMLSMLSGKEHVVITAVSLVNKDRMHVFSVDTKVRFRDLTQEEIEYYVEKFRPLDKAGAYGIQEWIGYAGVESIEGSYFNVMGLPVQRLYVELEAFVKSLNSR
ncbi:Maf family nucleotide pyrophosphatase [Williamwhitmania taraxaci]|uniref:dTTP/UTP pyrophosphatase n=1 Tax=Williamwhitmania taraxaci TaxID=1640674 RepID=A0A1G6GLJ1_9BACT|nr:Maf family nucleotide pyrophosphatase [Williamwhitmania taraxaci]SDB82026.1 septum formation protein [Williamwhitmania taraxaci]